jgi:hypothetical protein
LHDFFCLDAWNISADGFPADGNSEEKLWFLVRYAVLAPSSHNTQPWKFRIHGNVVEVFADFARALPIVDPDNRELVMSCGAALFHLRTAIRYFGHACDVEVLPEAGDPALFARIHLGLKCDTNAEDILLFNAIPKLRTNRGAFLAEVLPDALLAALSRVAAEEGAWLRVIEGEEAAFPWRTLSPRLTGYSGPTNGLLRARVEDVSAPFLDQPIELPHLRPRLAALVGREGFPQILLRLGFGSDVKPTPRRPVQEVMIRQPQHNIALTTL